jgi:hypothetical protein
VPISEALDEARAAALAVAPPPVCAQPPGREKRAMRFAEPAFLLLFLPAARLSQGEKRVARSFARAPIPSLATAPPPRGLRVRLMPVHAALRPIAVALMVLGGASSRPGEIRRW